METHLSDDEYFYSSSEDSMQMVSLMLLMMESPIYIQFLKSGLKLETYTMNYVQTKGLKTLQAIKEGRTISYCFFRCPSTSMDRKPEAISSLLL
jgi:hypothetical protein